MKQVVLIGLILGANWNGNISYLISIQSVTHQNAVKTEAYTVLRQKCNTCHAVKRKVSIFTYENMDSLSNAINQQVFVKRKMPKGKKNRLTMLKQENLKLWLETLKIP
jgi:predicted GIY-YIG superfamily endonuclease